MSKPTPFTRKRVACVAAIIVVIALGLASRKFPALFPATFGKYPGDALWAAMIFLGWALILPASSTSRLALYALLTSYADELSQLYQAPWINAVRHTTLGHLVLGRIFSWLDLVAYTAGIALCMLGEKLAYGSCKEQAQP